MRFGWLDTSWWGAAMLVATTFIGSCASRGGPDPNPELERADGEARMLFCEAVVGRGETAERWISSPEVEVTGFVTADGDAGVQLRAIAGGTVRATPEPRPDFAGANRVRIDLAVANASPESPVQVELSFYDDAQHNRWWKLVRFDDPSWHTLEVELPYLRYDRGTLPRWEDVVAWGMTFRTDADVRIRSFQLWQDAGEPGPYLRPDQLRDAFADPSRVRIAQRGAFTVLTDTTALDTDAVLGALHDMHTRTLARFPGLATPEQTVPLLVFADESSYRAFWRELSADMGSHARPLEEDEGYTWLGVATATYSDAYGKVRPVYVHEASHALIERALGLDAQRSWLFEGLGNVAQLDVSGQDIASVYRQGLVRSGAKMPVFEMLAGGAIPTGRYWQATLLVQFLLADAGRTHALAAALDDMRATGSADLRPHLERHFGMDVPRFSAAFWSWAWAEYARGPGA
jgi:hypothetical protein